MRLKVFRTFFGGYNPDYVKLHERGYFVMRHAGSRIITAMNEDQGFAKVKGMTKKLGENYSPVSICLFKRSTRRLLWETKSKADGSYEFRNIAVGLECFVVAFDPNNQYNAVIQDNVVPK